MTRDRLQFVSAIVVLALAFLVLTPVTARGAASQPPAPSEKVNINTAGVDELVALPGIGKAYAERIVEYRQKNGPFKKVEDLLNVRGIGEKTFDRIRERLTIGKN
ncbi:MAG TPA: helix-hairpin-helix domain-containing protein [Candidatus Polarisedimenticolia bacterium]|nr:helix-hairpin-helix domain-containing protein [Candidatus Polarisedimenticolia bacterium]